MQLGGIDKTAITQLSLSHPAGSSAQYVETADLWALFPMSTTKDGEVSVEGGKEEEGQ